MFKLFISRFSLSKKLLYEFVLQFAPIDDFYFTSKFCISTFKTKEDLVYAKEMLKTIRKLKVEDSLESVAVRISALPSVTPQVIKKIFSKFGSVKFREGVLFFKKKEAAERAIEVCSGKFIGYHKIKMEYL